MDLRRGGYTLVRVYVAVLVVGAALLAAWVLYPSLVSVPDFIGLWAGLAGFAVLAVAMLYLFETIRNQ